jgi:hypothetical protein
VIAHSEASRIVDEQRALPALVDYLIGVELWGAGATITVNTPELAKGVPAYVPFGAVVREPADTDGHFAVRARDGVYTVVQEDGTTQPYEHPHVAMTTLASHLALYLMSRSPEVLFIHATAVASGGRAIVLPGRMGTGKSMLMMALLRAGAAFYSDDYLPLDPQGRAHPYPLPPWFRDPESGSYSPQAFEALNPTVGEDPVPVGMIAHVVYKPGASLSVRPVTAGKGVLIMLDNALGTHQSPGLALTAARSAAARACVLECERDDADEAAAALLERLSAGV